MILFVAKRSAVTILPEHPVQAIHTISVKRFAIL